MLDLDLNPKKLGFVSQVKNLNGFLQTFFNVAN